MGAIELVIDARPAHVGGLRIRRILPSRLRRLVGPFIFLDHFGPVDFSPGTGMDVAQHPHIGLATVTYLFEGEILHRDSLGSEQRIAPGDVNWMIAGRGIVHSERTPPDVRARGGRAHGLQAWVALSAADEETAPRFEHHAAASMPVVIEGGVARRAITNSAAAPNALYLHARLEAGADWTVEDTHEERAAYVVSGDFQCEGRDFTAGALIIFRRGARARIVAASTGQLVLIGGPRIDGARHIFWNFVATSRERIERAKEDWRERRFPTVPGDDVERIELPD